MNILIIKITREVEITSIYLERIKGFYSFFENKKEYQNIKIKEIKIKESDNIELSTTIFEDVDSIFVPNSRAYIIAEFIKKNNLQGIKITGYDLLKRNID